MEVANQRLAAGRSRGRARHHRLEHEIVGTYLLNVVHAQNVEHGCPTMTTDRNKRERFIELGEARVRKATQMLRLIGNLSNASNYEYSQEDAQKILSALDNEMKLLRAKFQAALSRRAKDEFKLG